MSELKDPFGWVGETIDAAFQVEEVVGEGGFAVVYRGHHKGFDEKVAVKALKFPAKLGESERARFLESFTSEGKLLRKLSSADASIVQALDVGAAESPNKTWTPYLILEWLDGETLEADLRKRKAAGTGGRSLADAIALLEPAAKGLATAHGMGIAHRDVKPSNLFLVKQGERRGLKIVDFGIAKIMTDSEDVMRAYEATGESIHAFSPKYGAPEQFDRKFGATGPWTDVFALALVLVETVAGKSPMSGDTSQLFLAATNTSSRPTLRSVGVEESDAVEKVLAKALAVDPKERYADAGEFWSALGHAAAHADTVMSQRTEAAPTRREGRTSSVAPEAATDEATSAPTKASAVKAVAPPPENRAAQLAVSAVMVAVLGTAAYTVMPHHGLFIDTTPPQGSVEYHHLSEFSSDAEAAAVAPTAASVATVPGYVRYTNDRYKFIVDIPAEFDHYDESSSGDGRTYTSPLGGTIKIYGGAVYGGIDYMYRQAFDRKPRDVDRWVLPDHTLTSDMYVLTGYDHDTEPFLEKMIITGGIYAKLYVTYPPEKKGHYDPLLPHMRDSLSFTAVSDTRPIEIPDAARPPPVHSDASVPDYSPEQWQTILQKDLDPLDSGLKPAGSGKTAH